MTPVYVQRCATLSSPGGDAALAEAVFAAVRRPLPRVEGMLAHAVHYGAVPEALVPTEKDLLALRPCIPEWMCRQRGNRLAAATALGLEEEVERAKSMYGVGRMGVLIGTSVAGMSETEQAFMKEPGTTHWDVRRLEVHNPARFLQRFWGLTGPAAVVSSACTSSAKAIASAARWIRSGLCDAVVAGGVDAASVFTVRGFDALGVLSAGLAKPFGAHRDGINLGEASALFLLSKSPSGIRLAGWAETSDAHHVSAPDPEGLAVRAAFERALTMAGGADVDYVNAHGTGTRANDAMEGKVIAERLGGVPVSSTKTVTGHTLGAAGALEAAVAVEVLRRGLAPANLSDDETDPEFAALGLIRGAPLPGDYRRVMSTSFAFGGSNAVLIFERE